MQKSSIEQLIHKLKSHADEISSRETLSISIDSEDAIRLKALSELYRLPLEELGAYLMSEILQQVEAKIPYVQGNEVIRIEDGEPVYEDIGDTPRYLEIKRQIEEQTES